MKLKNYKRISLRSMGIPLSGASGRRPGDKFDFFEHPLSADYN
jgi:hypothetical protein